MRCSSPCTQGCEFEPQRPTPWLMQSQGEYVLTWVDLVCSCNPAHTAEAATAVHCAFTLEVMHAAIELMAATVSLQVSPHQAQNGAAGSNPAPAAGRASIPAREAAPANGAGCSHGVGPALLAERREDAELAQHEVKERQSLPKTIDGFKRHPLYVLQRHISKYQGLSPGASQLGVHRGEPYYDRAAVAELHAAGRWKRLGFEVLPGEMLQPAKVITHSKGKGCAKAPGRGRASAKEGPPADGTAQATEEVPPRTRTARLPRQLRTL